jgi:tetratricopeptide (TPR) repeat protein
MSKTCFVAMGFGKKTDYQSGRVLDLDKSYQYIIKPAAERAGLDCKRADEIIHSGLIDVPMYEQLLSADVVIADISTSNANAFYELGVRHALRPYTTITIAEDKMMFPFDVSHLSIQKYQHLGDGIDYGEVMRMQNVLVGALTTILTTPKNDSPVYTLFADLTPPVRKAIQQAVAQSAPSAAGLKTVRDAGSGSMDDTAKNLMAQAESARERSDFAKAVALLTAVRVMAPADPFVIQRLALATYKSKLPDALQALRDAKVILGELEPNDSTDVETVGLWGAIHKRLWELTADRGALDTALASYEKGFYLKNDYYNGINLAFLYNMRASISVGAEAQADVVIARRVRRRVLAICDAWLVAEEQRQQRNKTLVPGREWMEIEEKRRTEDKYWVLATEAEASAGLGDEEAAEKYFGQAKALAPAAYMVESTEGQLAALQKLLDAVKVEG